MNKELLEPQKLNSELEFQNKIVFAPATRCFADENLCATDDMANYYEKRADAGLIIVESTVTSKQAQGYPNQPGIYTKEQIHSWQKVNEKIHKKGAKSFCQLIHTGRVSHKLINGLTPVAPSKTTLEGRVPRTDFLYEEARELTIQEIKDLVQEFVQASLNSIDAGFDGVEIHGANGYLLDQFLHQCVNKREDYYGGNSQKRANFVLEVVDAVVKVLGKEKVAIRLSPYAYLNMEHTAGDEKTFVYILEELGKRDLAYVHTGTFYDKEHIDYLDGRVSEFMRKYYKGNLMVNGSYSIEEANNAIKENKAELVSFGRAFIANGDLVKKVKDNQELNEYKEELLLKLD